LQARLKALDEGNTKENTNTGYFSPNNQGLNVGESRGLEIDPKLASNPVVDVVAPDDLPGGFSFEAEMGTQRFLATVPAGGVRRGETFSTHMKKIDIEIPVGLWRDGLFSCFKHGVCHPLVVNTIACPLRKFVEKQYPDGCLLFFHSDVFCFVLHSGLVSNYDSIRT